MVYYLVNSFFKSSWQVVSSGRPQNNLQLHERSKTMVNGNCAVVGCTNSNYQLRKWKQKLCENHVGELHKDCPCPQPFTLHRFPSVKLNSERRIEWIRRINRTTKRKTEWTPNDNSDLVCSAHFIDGKPSLSNPDPTINLGYEKPSKKSRRELVRHDVTRVKNKKRDIAENDTDFLLHDANCAMQLDSGHPGNLELNDCQQCTQKDKEIELLTKKVDELTLDKTSLEQKVEELMMEKLASNGEVLHPTAEAKKSKNERQPFTLADIKSDAKMKFFTVISTIMMFTTIFNLLLPCLPKISYWRGKKSIISTGNKKSASRRSQKVSFKDQFLMVLMRLRLGLLNEDLADRFQISQSTCSNIFVTWIKILGKLLGNGLIQWLPRDRVYANLPKMFLRHHAKTRCIIDCSEIYIERPKSPDTQAATWSDYKKHNTMKFLIGIAPSGFITFISDCYGGRTTDRFICNDSNFYNLLEAGDEIMADRGFQIKEDLLHYYCTLSIPPGARVKSQFTTGECHKTKKIANLRIHVERAINRVKEFKILKNVYPINMLPLADDVIRTCAALCNMQAPLIKVKDKV